MSKEIPDSGRVIITRNDLQVRIKKPFNLNLNTEPVDQPTHMDATNMDFILHMTEFNLR